MISFNSNPFDKNSGSASITKPRTLLLLLIAAVLFAVIIAKLEIVGLGILFALILGGIYLYKLFTNPILGFFTAIGLNFIVLGIARYIPGLPLGFGIDGILILTYLALFFSRFKERIDWSPANKDLTFLAAIWLLYCIFQLANPEARSVEAWIAGRGIGFYFFLFIPLTFMLINTNKKLDLFLYVWGVFSILASMKGMIQLFVGVDAAEQAWLNGGAAQTHILFGKLRIFSFMSDAGQFGANEGLAGVVFIIYSMTKKGLSKMFFLTVGILGIYGMMISGTRGSISVPMAGFMTYFILSKNLRVVSLGFTLILFLFVFFKFTMIANGNDQIRRMRSAFDPNEPSLQVRLKNQEILKGYLASRPFGGGIGHAGDKAQRFLPNAFLSHVATDSWYVMIWAEMGIVGLTIHLCILFFVIGKASYKVMFKIRDPIAKQKLSALIAGLMGILAASYGNAVFGTMPTALLMYATIAIISNPETFDTPLIEEGDAQLIKS
ncbi:O-antigen ligase family protein [Flavobacterium soyangense]|uniref:O-antigen ligase domain-containing protein n=1 Tax=Flavobacterium soyangense TaxID=2023265 RepID=A0A930UA71_9FLAO|nr:O-antigen ligase family protein [Flavobacterium soyangense]MBF2707576.1 O-antigen ligase domain-containing protein [Flavobacterium soyangense]